MESGAPITAIIIDVDGSSRVEVIDQELGTMHSLLGGFIEAVYPGNNETTFWCHEEGKLIGLPVNNKATVFFRACGGRLLTTDYGLVGTVVITGGYDGEGWSRSVPDDVLVKFQEMWPSWETQR